MSDSKILALVMAGGAGSRMDPLTRRLAKPAIPYAGVYRLVDFPLSNCAHSGIADVWVLQQYEPFALGQHLAGGRPWDLDRTRGGLQILFPHQGGDESGWHQGNADAIFRNHHELRAYGPDIVIVLSADHVYKLNYRSVIEAHLERGAGLTMVTTVVEEDASRYGNVEVDDEGRVTGFAYKPDEPISDVVTTEVFVYDAAVLLDTIEELATEADRDGDGDADGGLEDFGDKLIPKLVERGQVWEYRLDGYWRDVGTLDSYWRSHMDLLEPDPVLHLDDEDWPILTTTRTPRPPARLFGSASVDNALVSPGCRVLGRVERSVLGPGVVVEEGATVRDSVLLSKVTVGKGAEVSGAICDMGACIGAGARVGQPLDPSKPVTADDLAVVGHEVRVADGATVPAGAREAGDE